MAEWQEGHPARKKPVPIIHRLMQNRWRRAMEEPVVE